MSAGQAPPADAGALPLAERIEALEARVEQLSLTRRKSDDARDGVSIVVFSGDLDRLLAALHLATAAAATGLRVAMFFTFWGLCALKQKRVFKGKGLVERLLTAMLPSTAEGLGTSRLNWLGLGPRLFGIRMRSCGAPGLAELLALARQSGVRTIACESSMQVMGITKEELPESVEYGGAVFFLDAALESKITLFI